MTFPFPYPQGPQTWARPKKTFNTPDNDYQGIVSNAGHTSYATQGKREWLQSINSCLLLLISWAAETNYHDSGRQTQQQQMPSDQLYDMTFTTTGNRGYVANAGNDVHIDPGECSKSMFSLHHPSS